MKKRSSSTEDSVAPSPCPQLKTSLVRSKWYHPLVLHSDQRPVARSELNDLAMHFYESFLPFFSNQKEGSIQPGIKLEFSHRMRQKLGLAYLFERRIRLNQNYFARDPSLLPYTLFHELTHVWLYDCILDPGHTARFYRKMREFNQTGLPIDPDVHVHSRYVPEAKYVYACPNCRNRWYQREALTYSIFCGHCFDIQGEEYLAKLIKTPNQLTCSDDSGNAA